jgi:hypothetical protein
MLKLGKKPARPDAVKLKFATYFDKRKLPTPPEIFGRYTRLGHAWDMLGNDAYGDCVFAGAAHETMLWTHSGSHTVNFTEQDVLWAYSAVTGFDVTKPETDQGTDVQEAAAYRQKTGIRDSEGNLHKINAYVAMRPGNLGDLKIAAYLFGAVGVGIMFPDSAMDQFDKHQVWTPVTKDRPTDGHYVPVVGVNSQRNPVCVTWGRLQALTPDFYETYCDEIVAYLSFDWLKANVSPDAFDLAGLEKDLAALAA